MQLVVVLKFRVDAKSASGSGRFCNSKSPKIRNAQVRNECAAIREKIRQLQHHHQAMDNRRRLEMNRHVSQKLMSRLPHVAKLLKVSPTSDVKSFEEDMDNLLDIYATPAADSGRRLAQDPRKSVKSDCNRQSFQDRHLPPPQPPPHQRLPDLRS